MEITKENLLKVISYECNGDWDLMYKTIKSQKKYSQAQIDEFVFNSKASTLVIGNKSYPHCFENITYPPLVLYYYGNLDLLSNNYTRLSVVGSRDPSQYAIAQTKRLIGELTKNVSNICIVSGMARGIDAISQREAMKNERAVITVLGSGIDTIYPPESSDIYEYCKSGKGLILSEYPENIAPLKKNFVKRNRLISSLSNALFVPCCSERSGTSITIRFATEQNKDILCLPERIDEDQYLNNLIKDGAFLINSPDDFYQFLKIEKNNLIENE